MGSIVTRNATACGCESRSAGLVDSRSDRSCCVARPRARLVPSRMAQRTLEERPPRSFRSVSRPRTRNGTDNGAAKERPLWPGLSTLPTPCHLSWNGLCHRGGTGITAIQPGTRTAHFCHWAWNATALWPRPGTGRHGPGLLRVTSLLLHLLRRFRFVRRSRAQFSKTQRSRSIETSSSRGSGGRTLVRPSPGCRA